MKTMEVIVEALYSNKKQLNMTVLQLHEFTYRAMIKVAKSAIQDEKLFSTEKEAEENCRKEIKEMVDKMLG